MRDSVEFEQKVLDVKDLELDPDNPRFCHVALYGRTLETQQELEEEIERDEGITTLVKAIKKSGVKDPIWVKGKEGGKYLVLEGNRRTVILRNLLKENVLPPAGVAYDKVIANVIDPSTTPQEMLLQKARLQAGKKVWGAFNEAAVTYILRKEYLLETEDIGTELQISMAEVKKRIKNYQLFNAYVKATGDNNTKKFSFFQDAPKAVREWYEDDEKNLKTYFNLITPKKGIQKIRSVSTKGGLRDFAKVLEEPEALEYLVKTETATVEDAYEVAKELDIEKDLPFIKRIGPLAAKIMSLDDPRIEKLRQEVQFINSLKQMRRACEFILEKLKEN